MAARTSKKRPIASEPIDFFTRRTPQTRHLLALGFLFLLPFILFYSTTLGGQQFMGHDVIQWRAGAESLIEHRNETGEVAHWAANMFSGMPATTISHPPQRVNVDTLLQAFSFIYPALEYWVLFGGAYLMFILMGFRPLTAVFGSVVIGFSTYIPIIIGAGHNAKFLAYIYIPWIYAGYLLLTRTSINRWLAFFVFGLALTLHLRAYHPQVTYFFFFPLITLFLYDLYHAWKEQQLPPFLRQTLVLAAAAGVAMLIAAQLYWSTAEYSTYSMRGGSELEERTALAQDYAFAWSQGVGELITLAVPNAYGGSSSEAYWGPKAFTSGPHYAGALTILFLLVGFSLSRHKLKWVFAGPGILTLLFALGEHFMLLNDPAFRFIPLFDKFRVPEMWLMVTVFCFAVVAVMGLSSLITALQARQPDWKKHLGAALAITLLLAAIPYQFLSFEKPGERQQLAQQIAQQNQVPPDDPRVSQTVNRFVVNELIPQRQEMARSDALRFLIFIGGGVVLLIVLVLGKLSASAALAGFSLLLVLDLAQVNQRYMNEGALVDGSVEREMVIERQQRELDQYIVENGAHDEGWHYRTLPLLDNPFNNAVPSYFYPSAGGYSGAKLGYYQDLIDTAIFSGEFGINTGVLAMLNVRYLTTGQPVQIPGFETALQTDQGSVIELQNVLPKAWFADQVEVLESERDVLHRISDGFDPGVTAFITDMAIESPQPDTAATVRVSHYGPNRIELQTERSTPGFLVLGEIWYPPGWQATLNNEPISIVRTNYVLRGFEIPAGSHTLLLQMEPVWYQTGNWLSAIGTLLLFGPGLFGMFIWYRTREKRVKEEDDE